MNDVTAMICCISALVVLPIALFLAIDKLHVMPCLPHDNGDRHAYDDSQSS